MSMWQFRQNGYYDDTGNWQRTKHCFAYCGQSCDCGPPGGFHYSAEHDKRLEKPDAAASLPPSEGGKKE